MSRGTVIDIFYLVAVVGFILALKALSSPRRARMGNLLGAAGMVLAVGATFARAGLGHVGLMVGAMAIGVAVGVPAARLVRMTAMPQMVAAFNGVGGGAAAVVSLTAFVSTDAKLLPIYKVLEVIFGVVIGSFSLSGSALSFAKLQELVTGRPIVYRGQQRVNAVVAAGILALLIAVLTTDSTVLLWILLVLSLALGLLFVLPIGGADVPVLISLLNAFTGLAVAASGFSLNSNLLVVAGTLVGASGTLLTVLMSNAMGRSLPNILFSAFGAVITAGTSEAATTRSVRAATVEDVAVLLAYARKVAIIPGYGLAVAQAQHAVRELANTLTKRGVEVFYAIHPIAGRMPGHMNVLLAEADVPYEDLREMEEANREMSTVDVALVVGANDTVNPAAKEVPGSPIYGMPIINADEAANIVFLKRSMRPGFAGIDNDLMYNPKTVMLFGDAKDSLQKLASGVVRV